jgi:hypothetical protein
MRGRRSLVSGEMMWREEREWEGNGRLNTGTFLYIIFGSNKMCTVDTH